MEVESDNAMVYKGQNNPSSRQFHAHFILDYKRA